MTGKVLDFNKHLELTLLPTEGCNFACKYCNQPHDDVRMQPEVVAGVKRYLDVRVPELETLRISWFGGEPMLGYQTVIDIMEYVRDITGSKSNSFIFTSNMSTNGALLTPERLSRLAGLGVKYYQISFDGDKEEHDKLRVSKGGKGTFDVIWKNIMAAHETNADFSISIRVHANSQNRASIERFLRRVSSELEGDKRFVVFIRPLARWGSKNDATLPILDGSDVTVPELRKQAEELGLALRSDESEYVCYAAKPFAYVIRADGSINKCTLYLTKPENALGRLMPDGRMQLRSELTLAWSRGVLGGTSEERACPAINFPIRSRTQELGVEDSNMLKVIR